MTFLGIPSAHLATTSASATTNKQVRNGVGSLCESVASQSVVHSSYMSYFIYFSQPIGICGFKGSTYLPYILYCHFKFIRIHAHVPECGNAKDVTFHVVNNLVIVVDDRSTIMYLSIGQ